MAKQKSRKSRVSNGGRQKANLNHEKKRQEYFAKRKEAGKRYQYKKNPYEEGTQEYERERLDRIEKAKSSRLPYARLESIFAKLDNQLNDLKLKQKEASSKTKEIKKSSGNN